MLGKRRKKIAVPTWGIVGIGCTIITLTSLVILRPLLAQTTTSQLRQLFEEGMALYQQGTPEARQQAIAKFEQLLKLSKEAGIQLPQAPGATELPTTDERIGLKFENGSRFNAGAIVQDRIVFEQVFRENGVEYVDRCPKGRRAIGYPHITDSSTTLISNHSVTPRNANQAELHGWFVSEKTPPAPGLRVVVRNVTRGMAKNPSPYTDREYDHGAKSERFSGILNDEHDGGNLAFAIGQNDFTYEIKRGNQVVESGNFSVTIDLTYNDITSTKTISRPQISLECRDRERSRDK